MKRALILTAVFCGASFAQQNAMTIEPSTFTGSGLNDATSGGTFVAVPENHFYTAEICSTGSPDTVQFKRDGGTGTSCVQITGVAMPVYYPVPSISSAAWSAGRATFTTSTPHGLKTGAKVTITGASPGGYNGSLLSINVTGASTFSVAIGTNPGAYTSGATVRATDGVTVTFAASTGHTAAAKWTIRANANGSLRTSGFIQAGIGARFRNAEEKMRDEVSVLDFCQAADVVDGSVEVTACVQNALNATPTGGALYFPPGIYSVHTVSVNGKSLSIRGAGPKLSTIQRHTSFLQENSYLTSFSNADSLTIRDMGFDQRGDGSLVAKSDIFLDTVNKITLDNLYVTRGQSSGILVIGRTADIKVTNSTFYQNWWIGIAFSGGGDTSVYPTSGIPGERIVVNGNTFFDMDYGVLASVYAYDVSITNNVFRKSSIGIAQATFRLLIADNQIYQAHTYGLVENADGIFVEAAVDTMIVNNSIEAVAGRGIFLQGSTLQIPCAVGCGPPGPVVEIPTPRAVISGNKINNLSNQPIFVHANSPGSVVGRQFTLENNSIWNSHSCITVNGENFKISGNHCENTIVQGFVCAQASYVVFDSNTIRNIGVALPGSYNGLEIGAGCHDWVVENNQIIDDQVSHSMRFGIYDAALDVGEASHVTYRNNTITGSGAQQIYPVVTCTPSNGTWNFGEYRQILDQGTGGGPGGCQNIVAGTPGKWVPTSLVPDVNGYYTVTDPLDEHKLLVLGVEHTSGEGDMKCFDLTAPAFKPCRVTGHGLKVVNGDTGVTVWNVDGAGAVGAISETISGNLHLTGSLTPPSGSALNGSTSCPTGTAITNALHSQGIATSMTCAPAFPGGASVTDTRLDSCGLSTSGSNVCTNAACTSTVFAITAVSLTCTQASQGFVNGLRQ